MRRFSIYWLPVLVWMGLIFQLSTGTGSPHNTSRFIEPVLRWLFPNLSPAGIGHIHYYIRKAAHVTEYTVLGWLLWRALWTTGLAQARGARWKIAGVALLLSALYAGTDEFHQSFVPGREASVRDVCLDTCGAFLGLSVLGAWNCRREAIAGPKRQ